MKKLIGKIGLVVIGCGVGFLLLELGLRVFGISYPYFYIPDDLTGYTLKPGTEGLWHKEGEAYITINHAGWRDREHSLEKPDDTFRIVVLGDSYAEALQVPIEKTFWARLEQELPGCPALSGRTVEVLNFGVSGYSTAQELIVLRHKAAPYRPDLVMLALFTENDVRGNLRELDINPLRPYFLMEDGHLVLDDSFRRSVDFRLQHIPFSSVAFENSRMLQVAREAKYKLMAYWKKRLQQQGVRERGGGEIDIDLLVYRDPIDSAWESAWAITDTLVPLIRSEAEELGSRFLLVSLSNPDQVHPEVRHQQEVARQVGMPDLFYPERRLKNLAKRERIEFLTLAEPFAEYATQHGTYLHGFSNAELGKGHWNMTGHRLAGDLMAQKVCQMMDSRSLP